MIGYGIGIDGHAFDLPQTMNFLHRPQIISIRAACIIPLLALLVVPFNSPAACAQLRIVTYNPTGAPATGIDVVLKSIGEELRNGIAKPIDVLLLQEQANPSPGASNPSPDTQQFVTLLNNLYNNAGITYAMSNRTGGGDTTQTLVYRTQTVQLIGDAAIGTISAVGAPRQPVRFQLRPVGYDSSADFYIYNSHYKASAAIDDPAAPGRRNVEATSIRTSSNALGEGAHVIYAGDHNFYDFDSDEPAWGTLTASGAGQANDPISQVGTWHNNSSFAAVHTQSPCTSSTGNCFVTGGMDDRFDFQLTTGEFLDGEGLSYIGPIPGVPEMSALTHSYHAFGNNGTSFNKDIVTGNTVTFPGVSSYTKSQILTAIRAATDHIPVVADYQLPAVMNVVAGTAPTVLDVGQAFNLSVTVNNSANVVAAIGADELNYSLTSSGNVSGSFLNQIDQALGGSNVHSIAFDTATIGMKTGLVTVMSSSQGVQNGTFSLPISYLVVLPGDYDGNAIVDAADYVVWRETQGTTVAAGTGADGDRNGLVDESDYGVWRTHFGASAAGAGSTLAATVPEPSVLALLMIGVCLGGRRRTKLRACSRTT